MKLDLEVHEHLDEASVASVAAVELWDLGGQVAAEEAHPKGDHQAEESLNCISYSHHEDVCYT